MRRRYFPLVAGLVCAGCGSDAEPPMDGPVTWTVSAVPDVTIGVADGDERYLFGRIADARLLPGDRVAVSDLQAATIRIYGLDGEFRLAIGGKGEGPGEFDWLGRLWLEGDTLAAYDDGLVRVSWFRLAGDLLDTRQLYPALGTPLIVGSLSDGDLVGGWIYNLFDRPDDVAVDDSLRFARFGADGEVGEVLGQVTGFVRRGGFLDPVSPGLHPALYGDTLFFTNGLRSVSVHGPDGARVREFPLPDHGLTPDEAWAEIEAEVAARQDENRTENMQVFPRHERIPRASKMLIDDQGNLWIKRFVPTDASVLTRLMWWRGGEWLVLDREGRQLASVDMPDELMPLDIRGDRILGFYRDDLLVERIRVYTLTR